MLTNEMLMDRIFDAFGHDMEGFVVALGEAGLLLSIATALDLTWEYEEDEEET